MIAAKVAEVIRRDEFGDQFVVLRNLDLYTAEVGLDWEDVTFRNADRVDGGIVGPLKGELAFRLRHRVHLP